MSRWVAWGVLAFVGVVAACSDPPSKPGTAVVSGMPPTASGGGAGDGGNEAGTGEAGLDGGACTDLTITGLIVDRVGVQGDPPAATGGTIVDGNYDLTAFSVFVGAGGVTGPTGISARATIRIAAGKIDEVIELGGTGKTATTKASRSAFSATGATFAQTELCPTVGGGKQLQFTATDPILVLTDLSSKEAFTFTKR